MPVKTYVSFQLTESGPTKPEESFASLTPVPISRIVKPGSDWQNTIYEVVNGTIVYPPSGIDINILSLVIHVDISSEGIIKNPSRVRSIKLSGKTLNAESSNPIGTRSGNPVIPYKRYGFYLEHKSKNPYIIYTDSTPHLYLTKNSGIEMTGLFGVEDRGMSIPVNREKRSPYTLAAIQFSMRFSRNDLVSSPTQILQIENNSRSEIFRLWIEPLEGSSKRFKIYATDISNNLTDTLGIYLNGKESKSPTISVGDWNTLGISLIEELNLSGQSGRINFVGPILFNNVSYYALNAMQEAKKAISLPENYVGIDPSEIYNAFVGTNKVIFGDSLPIFPEKYRYSFINGISLQSATIKPV